MTDRNKLMLIVDDSPLIVERVTAMLEGSGTIIHAGSYNESIAPLAETTPDIVILDINLPGKSGIDLLRYIKATYPNIIIIMLSNQSGDYYRKLCTSLGARYFVDKSTQFEELPDIVASLL